jgi:ribosomal protein S18 acetylase RimI-like enzyme
MSTQLLTITAQDFRQAAQVLGNAFVDEPVSVAVYRDFNPERRARALTADFSSEFAVCVRKGYPIQLREDGRVVAAALIYPPGSYPLPAFDNWAFLLKSVLANGWYDVKSWLKWLDETDRAHPTTPHYYLEYIGVEPGCQGMGYGSILMEHLSAKADQEGVGCYLENANPSNNLFYQRFGYEIMGEKKIIGFPAWFLWREPRKL